MVTLTEPTIDEETTAADQIQKVIDRLEQGEELISFELKQGDNFCILGLFADESGIGRWVDVGEFLDFPESMLPVDSKRSYEYIVNGDDIEYFHLSQSLVNHYNLKDGSGSFDITALPESLLKILMPIVAADHNHSEYNFDSEGFTISGINDLLVQSNADTKTINYLLAEIIKSGVIFESDP